MEHFDYLTYKQNKKRPQKKVREGLSDSEKKIISIMSVVTFAVFFLVIMILIASKTSKIDIEYGRLGKDVTPISIESQNEDDEERIPHEKYTIDKRLFLISQEEKGPSESRVIEKMPNQSEVISKDSFMEIKENSEMVTNKAEKQAAVKNNPTLGDIPKNPQIQKAIIKPKLNELPQTPAVKPQGAPELQTISSKVLTGKYYSIEEARSAQENLKSKSLNTFVKRINGYYTLQVGAYDNFETAKNVAGKLKSKGLDVWIYQ